MSGSQPVHSGRECLELILTGAGLSTAGRHEVTVLTGGTYNTAYRVGRPGHTDLVVKIAPATDAPRMTYESGIMATEAGFYRAAAGRIPVPEVVHADFSRTVVDRDVLVMTHRPGVDWHGAAPLLDPAASGALRAQLGGQVAALHEVTGAGFGYPQRGLSATWRAAFQSMMAELLGDAERYPSTLPCAVAEIRALVLRHIDVLDAVTVPVLVHFDLWPGNILVDQGRNGHRISGIVDGERSFWGDPIAELVSLALFGDIREDTDFLAGYASGGGSITFDRDACRRLALYRTYLYLIMLVEMVPRGRQHRSDDPFPKLISEHLVRALSDLAAGR